MTSEKTQRIFGIIEHALMGAGALALILIVHTEAYKDEVRMDQEWRSGYAGCTCKPEIKGRELVASVCQAPTNLGPWDHECLYQKEKQ